jgi:hypothetical protein
VSCTKKNLATLVCEDSVPELAGVFEDEADVLVQVPQLDVASLLRVLQFFKTVFGRNLRVKNQM